MCLGKTQHSGKPPVQAWAVVAGRNLAAPLPHLTAQPAAAVSTAIETHRCCLRTGPLHPPDPLNKPTCPSISLADYADCSDRCVPCRLDWEMQIATWLHACCTSRPSWLRQWALPSTGLAGLSWWLALPC